MTEKKDAIAKRDPKELAAQIETAEGGFALKTVRDAMDFAEWNFQSGLLPDHIDNPKKAFAIMARGAEMGLKPHSSWRWIYMTKGGKLAMETKGMLAVCQASPHFAGYKEWIENEEADPTTWKAHAVAKRKGREDQVKTFSYKDAETAGLSQQKRNRKGELYDGPWQGYLKDMLLSRARQRALELQFSDVLGGIASREVQEEIESRDDTGQISSPAPTVTVHDPLLDEVSGGPHKAPETQEVIDAQVDEALPPEPEAEKDSPKEPTSQACRGCGCLYHIDRTGCPECGVPSGEDPAPPKGENEAQEEEAKHRRGQMRLTDD